MAHRFCRIGVKHVSLFGSGLILGLIVSLLASGCSFLDFRLPALGKAGKYRIAKRDLAKPRGTGASTAVPLLEAIVKKDPFYLDPRYVSAYHDRASAYVNKGEYEQAIIDYDKVLEIDPKNALAYFNKARACEAVGKIPEAVAAYRGFIEHAPPQQAPYIQHARKRIAVLEK